MLPKLPPRNPPQQNFLTCIICKQTVQDPVKSSCPKQCNFLMCKSHTLKISKCPYCRIPNPQWIPDHTAQSILNTLSQTCKCGKTYKLPQRSLHQITCPLTKRLCPKCQLQFNPKDMLDHLKQYHYREVFQNFNLCLNNLNRNGL